MFALDTEALMILLGLPILAVQWRTIQHYGFDRRVAITGDRGSCFTEAGERKAFSEKGGRWPVHVDPDDVRQVYFT